MDLLEMLLVGLVIAQGVLHDLKIRKLTKDIEDLKC